MPPRSLSPSRLGRFSICSYIRGFFYSTQRPTGIFSLTPPHKLCWYHMKMKQPTGTSTAAHRHAGSNSNNNDEENNNNTNIGGGGWRETTRSLLERAVSDWSIKILFRRRGFAVSTAPPNNAASHADKQRKGPSKNVEDSSPPSTPSSSASSRNGSSPKRAAGVAETSVATSTRGGEMTMVPSASTAGLAISLDQAAARRKRRREVLPLGAAGSGRPTREASLSGERRRRFRLLLYRISTRS